MYKLTAVIAVLLAGTGLYTGAPLNSSAVSPHYSAMAEQAPPAGAAAAAETVYAAPAPAPAAVNSAPDAAAAPGSGAAAPMPIAPAPGPGPAPAEADKPPAQAAATLESAVNEWKATLSKQKGFESWQKATWTSQTLGPGTHGWIVILKQGGSEVGYMVVHAAGDGTFRLGEYGTGKNPLFSLNTLYKSLVQHELIDISFSNFAQKPELHGERLYFNPLQAVWKVRLKSKTHLIDAKTGELLPIREADLPAEAAAGPGDGTKAADPLEKLELPAFDPYEKLPWVKGKPLEAGSFAELKRRLAEKKNVTLVGYLYGYQVTVPLAVTGFHAWSGNGYVLLEQDGLRAVEYGTLPSSSRFYR